MVDVIIAQTDHPHYTWWPWTDLLVEEVDGQDTLHGVSVLVSSHAAHPEVAHSNVGESLRASVHGVLQGLELLNAVVVVPVPYATTYTS